MTTAVGLPQGARKTRNLEKTGAASGYVCAACAGRVLTETHCVGAQTSFSVVYTASGAPILPPHTLQHYHTVNIGTA